MNRKGFKVRRRAWEAGRGRVPEPLVPGLAAWLLLGVLCLLLAGSASASELAGRPLAEVLAELRQGALAEEGLTLVFTSELVRPEMRVGEEPEGEGARAVLVELVVPHGLAVEEAEAGVLVVVRGEPRRGAIAGNVRVQGGGEVVAAEVMLWRAGADGAGEVMERQGAADSGDFSFTDLPPGSYRLEARAEGYLAQRLEDLAVVPGEARTVLFRLVPRPYVEEEIVVRPSRFSLLHDKPDASLAMGRDEIESLPHLGDDAFRIVSLLPGTASSDVSARFSVHGGRRDEVRIVLDGMELYDAFHLKDYDGALSIVPARSLEGMSLTTGAYPASQGDRMSGILDLRTLRPQGPRVILALGALDAMAAASGGVRGGDADGAAGGDAAGGDAVERGGWLLSARRGSLELAGKAVGDEEPSFWDILGKVEVDTGVGRLAARALVADDGLRVNTTEDESFERLANDYTSLYGWLTHAWSGERLLVETLGSRAELKRDRRAAVREEEGEYALRDRRDTDIITLSQDYSWLGSSRHLSRWGWEARSYEARFDYDKDLELDLVVEAPFSAPRQTVHAFDDTISGEDLALWASHRLTGLEGTAIGLPWLDRLTAELGLRYDRHGASDGTILSPRVNLAWRLGEARVLRLAWGRFAQSQRPYELQVEDGESELSPVERSQHWVLGYEALLGRGMASVRPTPHLEGLRVEAFHRNVSNPRPRYESLLEPLNFFPEVEPDRVRLDPESSTAYGLEMLLKGRWGRKVDGFLAYTWSRARDRLRPEAGGADVRRHFDQPHAANLGVHFRLPRSWDLNLAWRFHSGWPTTPVEFLVPAGDGEDEGGEGDDEDGGVGAGEPAARFGPLYSQRLSNYHRLDMRASRRWNLKRGSVTFYVDVQNLYDRQNPAGFDLALDDGELELEGESWPGVVPSLGLVLELGRRP